MLETTEAFPDRMLSPVEVCKMTGLSRTTLWRARQNGWFPEPRYLSPGRIGWPLSVVLAWMKQPHPAVRESKAELDGRRSEGRLRGRRPSESKRPT